MTGKRVIGERLKELRLERGLTVKELAERAGVSQSYVYAVEAGTRGSQVDKLVRIAKALGVDLSTLIGEGGN
ncbi:MAG: helix-turn-helix transcriptional regulator [Alicyclobacillaceae bacterium]|nr:helix-turn-helix transcriptional regulator [Alicyclobacillaceae bacterium]